MSKRTMSLILGIAAMAGGLFMIGQLVTVTSFGFSMLRVGGFSVPSGTVVIPLLVGIGMMVYNHRSLAAKIVTVVGVVCILLSLLLGVRLRFLSASLYEYVLMFGLVAAGAALLLRYWFKKA